MRTTIVSTSKLKAYKIIVIIFFVIVIILGVIHTYQRNGIFWKLYFLIMVGYFSFFGIRAINRLKNVSFDESSIYYDRDGYEVQIPFNEIMDIEIKSIDGIYKINLFQPNQDGNTIYFKTSIWYPFNFKRKDEQVNVLREMITRYKRNMAPMYNEQLPGRRI